ncbi:dihydrodipicolinate synthase family protein [Algoriphagus sp. D3-2-R+10]|uniref:dihydrodipicolinate synthase family protein n=1 Tax=Algoriphagus aurantiacus TaxID=3103948 RepID=UPI002B373CBC|nr:dihydrodipicolinate synthase family protein [Algoriphagus sp. D3-2-R+10]MEB2777888.1 dihydrodipicolinate synthase family protein [Algoriphagus sp. D3-2-R+10]
MSFPKPFRGIIPPMITPLNQDFSLDEKSLDLIIEHMIAGGVHGIFILGTTGEFASLSSKVKKRLIELTCRIVNHRIPVLVGITDCSFQESLDLAVCAKEAKADILVATTPFYMNVDQDELAYYFSRLADDVDLPLYLYNMPSHTGINIDLETVKILADHPNIKGIKDSSGDQKYFESLCDNFREYPEFTVLVGPEEILVETMNMGGHGGVTGGANLFPELYVRLFEAIEYQDEERIKVLNATVQFLSKNLYSHGTYQSNYLKGLKASMSFKGLCQGILALPLCAFNETEKEALKEKYNTVKEAVVTALSREIKL